MVRNDFHLGDLGVVLRGRRGSRLHPDCTLHTMAKTPKYTQKTLALVKELGWRYYKAEYWQATPGQQRKGVRRDAFGFGDIDAIRPAPDGFPFPKQSVLIQSTSAGCISARRKKILNECAGEAQDVLNSGRAIEIWGWHQIVKPGLTQAGKRRKQKEWCAKIVSITLDMFAQEAPPPKFSTIVEKMGNTPKEQAKAFNEFFGLTLLSRESSLSIPCAGKEIIVYYADTAQGVLYFQGEEERFGMDSFGRLRWRWFKN
jgi:hypothetical protein